MKPVTAAQPIGGHHTEGHTSEPVKDFTHPHLYMEGRIHLGMTRVLNPGMKLRGWLALILPEKVPF